MTESQEVTIEVEAEVLIVNQNLDQNHLQIVRVVVDRSHQLIVKFQDQTVVVVGQ